MRLIMLCLVFLALGCSHFKMETPRDSETNPVGPQVYDEDIAEGKQ
ncbi:MAG: hypothetical protein PHC54_03715 [Candidatus Omnitrophica bacterium]|nr:hypothetical protein [Candidatus Omnitrophota bacterium]MDD5592342.1 hypothetical protein [Candidatus Omnitrophota bacterium]